MIPNMKIVQLVRARASVRDEIETKKNWVWFGFCYELIRQNFDAVKRFGFCLVFGFGTSKTMKYRAEHP